MVEVNKPASQRTTDMCKNIISLAEVITGNEVHEATNFRFVLKSVTCSICASRHKWSLIKNPSRFLAHGIIMILFLLCHSLFTPVQFPIKSSEHKAPGTCFLMMSHSLTLSRRACPQSTSCLPSTPGGLVIDSPSWLNIIFCFTSKQQGGNSVSLSLLFDLTACLCTCMTGRILLAWRFKWVFMRQFSGKFITRDCLCRSAFITH